MSRVSTPSWPSFLLLDVAPTVAVGFAVFYLLCLHVADLYPVKSDSMEPTIHGDPVHGDRVLVNKLAWKFGRPEPFELVVIRGTKAGDSPIVKRCVVIADEHPIFLRIRDGDLYRRDDSGRYPSDALPIVKDPVEFADLRIPVFRHPDPKCEQILDEFMRLPPRTMTFEDGSFALPPAALTREALLGLLDETVRQRPGEMAPDIAGFLATNKPVDTSFLTPAGRREWRDLNFYQDIGIELEFDSGGDLAAVMFVLEYRDSDYALLWDQTGVRLVLGGVVQAEPVVQTRALAQGSHHVVFGYQDGHLFLIRAGEKLFYAPVVLDRKPNYRRPNRLHVGVGGPTAPTVRRIEVFHDLAVTSVAGRHGTGAGEYTVPKDHMFLLGDNPHYSMDSRGALGSVPLTRLVGRPTAILAPSERARFFVR